MACELAHFYNYKYEEVTDIDHQTFDTIYLGMQRIIAKDMLRNFTVSSYPHIADKKERKRIHRNLSKVAYPENFSTKTIKNDDLKLV